MRTTTRPVIPITPQPAAGEAVWLYEKRRQIYPRAVSGRHAAWRVALVVLTQLVFYGLPWLPWNGRQAVLFDLTARRFYCLLYTSPSPRDISGSRMPSSA